MKKTATQRQAEKIQKTIDKLNSQLEALSSINNKGKNATDHSIEQSNAWANDMTINTLEGVVKKLNQIELIK